jgi:AcrR family transcriptional regulator
MSRRATYHHGDLRRTLLDASLALAEESGVAALSLREVARKAGVSHNAPYHHFPDKGALLAAIADEGFEALAREMTVASAAVPDGPRAPLARLEACGLAYVRYALKSRAHFRVMFRPELAQDACVTPRCSMTRPFELLVESIVACQRAGQLPDGDPMPLVLTCWSAVHGLASLWLDGPLSLDPKGFGKSPEKLAATVVGTLSSLATAAMVLPAPRARQGRDDGARRRTTRSTRE